MTYNTLHKNVLYLIITLPVIGLILNRFLPLKPALYYLLLFTPFLLLSTKNIYLNPYIRLYILFVIYDIIVKYYFHGRPLLLAAGTNIRTVELVAGVFALLSVDTKNISLNTYERLSLLLKIVLYTGAIISIIQFINPSFLAVKRTSDVFFQVSQEFNRPKSIFAFVGDDKAIMIDVPILLAGFLPIAILRREKLVHYIIPSVIIILLTQSRGAYIALLVVLIINFGRSLKKSSYLVLLLALTVFTVSLVSSFDLNLFIENRLYADTDSRTNIIPFFMDNFKDEIFWFGDGSAGIASDYFRQFGLGSKLHNGFIAAFWNYGLIGGILFSLFFFSFVKYGYSIQTKTEYKGVLAASLAFGLVNLTVDVHHLFWMSIILLMPLMRFYKALKSYSDLKLTSNME